MYLHILYTYLYIIRIAPVESPYYTYIACFGMLQCRHSGWICRLHVHVHPTIHSSREGGINYVRWHNFSQSADTKALGTQYTCTSTCTSYTGDLDGQITSRSSTYPRVACHDAAGIIHQKNNAQTKSGGTPHRCIRIRARRSRANPPRVRVRTYVCRSRSSTCTAFPAALLFVCL